MYIGKESKVIVQGITGSQGTFHTELMLKFGTNIVAGVTPNKGGQKVLGVPVYDTVKETVDNHGADTSIVFVPARFALDAVKESINAGIQLTCIITENIPIYDMLRLVDLAEKKGVHLVGPNTPGILIPEQIKLGIMPNDLCPPGDIIIISKSGTFSYEIAKAIADGGMGITALMGIGGDPVRGTTMLDTIKYYEKDQKTNFIVIVGEIGGDEEEKVAAYIKNHSNKPIVAIIAGKHAPEGKRMGHAGAIISGDFGTAQGKIKALKNAGVHIANVPWDIPKIIEELS